VAFGSRVSGASAGRAGAADRDIAFLALGRDDQALDLLEVLLQYSSGSRLTNNGARTTS
jgi:hypothetical protein